MYFGELADASEECEFDMGIIGLDRRIQTPQKVAVGAGDFRLIQHIQNWFVIFVNENSYALSRLAMQHLDDMAKA